MSINDLPERVYLDHTVAQTLGELPQTRWENSGKPYVEYVKAKGPKLTYDPINNRRGEEIGGGFFVFRRGKGTGRVGVTSPLPYEHPDYYSATEEAKRLTRLTGEKYSVFMEAKPDNIDKLFIQMNTLDTYIGSVSVDASDLISETRRTLIAMMDGSL